VTNKRQEILNKRNENLPKENHSSSYNNFKPNEVKVVDKDYLDRMFHTKEQDNIRIIHDTIKEFTLNKEQERAFRIVTNHAITKNPKPLKMYMGGMAGTGKSQVIKSLMHFFSKRKEEYRFLVLAPTGAAAALNNGSTYHSVLGINEGLFSGSKSIAQIRANLDGVDYIFLDEVSMMSCRDLYKISAQCAKARDVHGEAFGGISFVFAGDFAQLPPAHGGYPLYSGNVGTNINSSQTVSGQESAIGKALWHQVTDVVILRQNMRQKQQTEQDSKLRTALENMRYRSCTTEDIAFLKSRIAGKGPNKPKLAQKRFRNVSIITAFNNQRDKINELGCKRFSEENNRPLKMFYSMDRWSNNIENDNIKGKQKDNDKKNLSRNKEKLPPHIQKILWEQPHGTSDKHVPGKLTLCIGMPIMLKRNDATECCITKGAEATVVNWQTIKGPEGQDMLDTLFVKLKNPPKTIQMLNLPENVVPITRHVTTTKCYLPNDDALIISRDQCLVLPNFAMTDFACQGRTRPDNVVDLSSCRNHQSYYTCLSRSASADGTILIQGFHESKITGGVSGYLRQEFRELEILDEITRLQYENCLPKFICGSQRNVLIAQFRKWKGEHYVPSHVHPAIKWGKANSFKTNQNTIVSEWRIVQNVSPIKNDEISSKRNRMDNFVTAAGTIPIMSSSRCKKRKGDDDSVFVARKKSKNMLYNDNEKTNNIKNKRKSSDVDNSPKKKRKILVEKNLSMIPIGIIWNGENFSCAYDALFVILYNIWSNDRTQWSIELDNMNNMMDALILNFKRLYENKIPFEKARDNIRQLLHNKNPTMFPYGRIGTDICDLIENILFSNTNTLYSWYHCNKCNTRRQIENNIPSYVIYLSNNFPGSIAQYLQRFLCRSSTKKCRICKSNMDRISFYKDMPGILTFSNLNLNMTISKKFKIKTNDLNDVTYRLKGIIYHGGFHFNSRIITLDNNVWFHDGMTYGKNCIDEGELNNYLSDDLSKRTEYKSCLLVYAKTL